MSNFKIGQRVKLVAFPGTEYNGLFGKVLSPYDVLGYIELALDSVPVGSSKEWQAGGFFVRGHEIELAEKETKVTEFRKGDIIRVLDIRNGFGETLSYREEDLGREFVIEDVSDVNANGKLGDWIGYGLVGHNSWVRSDDIELVSRETEMDKLFAGIASASKPTASDTLIEDLLASNERLSDANEAKRERLEAIRAIVTAADVAEIDELIKAVGDQLDILTGDGYGSIISVIETLNRKREKEEKLPKYGELLEEQTTSKFASFWFTRDEFSSSGFGVNVRVHSGDCYEADDLEEFGNHVLKLAKRIRKKIAKSNAN